MIDIKLIREDPEKFKQAAKAKNFKVDIDRVLQLDSDLKEQKQKLQVITTEKNQIGKSIPNLSADDKQSALAKLAQLKKDEAEFNE